MIKHVIPACIALGTLVSCSALRQLPGDANKDISRTQNLQTDNTGSIKFLDQIEVTPQSSMTEVDSRKKGAANTGGTMTKTKSASVNYMNTRTPSIESATANQLKYAVLLNTEVEEVTNLKLFDYIDEWYGTKYCMGGTSKKCIDCSAFVQNFYADMFKLTIPRTARDQYAAAEKISSTELQEGDLLFFNTIGGVSHVGIYLQNNKFVHASSSDGVTISDMFEPYWVRHLVGAGRIRQ
jgi:cell wall-associated NlpC family hydrolase